MVKDNETVIQYASFPSPSLSYRINTQYREFNELVNMSASALETWLKTEDSTSSGWSKEDGSETIGHERFTSPCSISPFDLSN